MMALFCYFQPANSLPTAKETQLGDVVTQSANAAVNSTRGTTQTTNQPRKRKAYTVFTAEQRAAIGRYALDPVVFCDLVLDGAD